MVSNARRKSPRVIPKQLQTKRVAKRKIARMTMRMTIAMTMNISMIMIQSTLLMTVCTGLLSPRMLPEEVVQGQLQALQQSDFRTAFKFISPASKEVMDESWQTYSGLVSSPPFDPLVGHSKASVLMTSTSNADIVISTKLLASDDEDVDDNYVSCLVRVVPSDKIRKGRSIPCLQYWWEVSKQYEDGPNDQCWMIDSVMPDFEDMDFDLIDLGDGEEFDDNAYFDAGF